MEPGQISSESYCASGLAEDCGVRGAFNAQSNQFQSQSLAVYLPYYGYSQGHAQTGRLIPAGIASRFVAPVTSRSDAMPLPLNLEHGNQAAQAADEAFVKDNTTLLDAKSSKKDTSPSGVEFDFNTPIKHDKSGLTTYLSASERTPATLGYPRYRDLCDDAPCCAPSGTISVTMGLVSRSITDPDKDILTAAHHAEDTKFFHEDDVADHVFTWLQHVPSASGLDQVQNGEHGSPEPNDTKPKSTLGGLDQDQTMMLHEDSGRILNRWLRFEEWTSLESSLPTGHPFNALISIIILRALDGFSDWRTERNRGHNTSRDSECHESEQTSQSGVTFKRNEVLEFACPYYKKSPSRYAECLKRCRLKTVDDVKNHLWQKHRIPFYCPVCKREFPTASGRDQHIVKRICALEDIFPFEGVSDDQRRQLFRRRKNFGERKQWFQIWKLLLPKEPVPKSAYLKAAHGLEVAMFRDFWSFQGDTITSDAVREANLVDWGHRNEERDLACLYTEVLYGAIEQIMARLDII